MPNTHKEPHRIKAIGWLRAAVLGANDGIISTASLIIGVASAHAEHGHLVLTGQAGLAAGSMSMATGAYVLVSSQADTGTAASCRCLLRGGMRCAGTCATGVVNRAISGRAVELALVCCASDLSSDAADLAQCIRTSCFPKPFA